MYQKAHASFRFFRHFPNFFEHCVSLLIFSSFICIIKRKNQSEARLFIVI